ncbi:hypothetical protein ACOSQ3_014043 [Xanthoceras sorbifolium]
MSSYFLSILLGLTNVLHIYCIVPDQKTEQKQSNILPTFLLIRVLSKAIKAFHGIRAIGDLTMAASRSSSNDNSGGCSGITNQVPGIRTKVKTEELEELQTESQDCTVG